jgi:hypothetical protein
MPIPTSSQLRISLKSIPDIEALYVGLGTYNAAWYNGATKEAQIQNAINSAVSDGALYVFVPANMLPYNASLVTFNTAVKMVREDSDPTVWDWKAYGAAGDNATDDTVAINAALAATTVGGTCRGSSATYRITSQLLAANAGIIVEGEGEKTLINQVTNNVNGLQVTGAGVEVRSLMIQGTGFGLADGSGGNGVTFDAGADHSSVHHCRVFNFGTGEIRVHNAQYVRVLDNYIDANNGNNSMTIWVSHDTLPSYALIKGNICLNGKFEGIQLETCQRASVIGNICIGDHDGIVCTGGAQVTKDNNIIGNIIINPVTFGVLLQAQAGAPFNPATGNLVEGNTVIGSGQHGITISNVVATNVDNSIVGNKITTTGTTFAGIFIGGGRTSVIGNTVIAGGSGNGISLGDPNADNCTVVGNTVTGTVNGGHGIFVGARANPIVIGNQVNNNAGWGILAQNMTGTPYVSLNTGTGNGSGLTHIDGANAALGPQKVVVLTDAATIATDASSGSNFQVTLTASGHTVGVPTNPFTSQRATWTIIQDGTGGRTLLWNAVFKVSWSDAGNTLGKRSSVSFIYDGTNWNQDGAQTPYM